MLSVTLKNALCVEVEIGRHILCWLSNNNFYRMERGIISKRMLFFPILGRLYDSVGRSSACWLDLLVTTNKSILINIVDKNISWSHDSIFFQNLEPSFLKQKKSLRFLKNDRVVWSQNNDCRGMQRIPYNNAGYYFARCSHYIVRNQQPCAFPGHYWSFFQIWTSYIIDRIMHFFLITPLLSASLRCIRTNCWQCLAARNKVILLYSFKNVFFHNHIPPFFKKCWLRFLCKKLRPPLFEKESHMIKEILLLLIHDKYACWSPPV